MIRFSPSRRAAELSPPAPLSVFRARARPLLVAHRGGGGIFPENTMPAFVGAARLGVDAVELDAHLTADGELVVLHDPTLERTTDGAGAVAEMRLAEIQKHNAAARRPDCRPRRRRRCARSSPRWRRRRFCSSSNSRIFVRAPPPPPRVGRFAGRFSGAGRARDCGRLRRRDCDRFRARAAKRERPGDARDGDGGERHRGADFDLARRVAFGFFMADEIAGAFDSAARRRLRAYHAQHRRARASARASDMALDDQRRADNAQNRASRRRRNHHRSPRFGARGFA